MLNRRSFDRAIQARAHSVGHDAVLVLDVDEFKSINNTFGHDAGDRVLVAILLPKAEFVGELYAPSLDGFLTLKVSTGAGS